MPALTFETHVPPAVAADRRRCDAPSVGVRRGSRPDVSQKGGCIDHDGVVDTEDGGIPWVVRPGAY